MHKRKRIKHIPVLLSEAIEGLNVQKGKQYIDATLGSGGHSLEIIKKGGSLLGIDRDPLAIKRAKIRLPQATLCVGNFAKLEQIATRYGFNSPSGILFDLGISSDQIADSAKGLSFEKDGPLDMRFAPSIKKSAKNLVNNLSEKELYAIFTRNAQEELARPIAKAIVSARRLKPIARTLELAHIVAKAKRGKRQGKLHPATKVFLALRIEVNDEINNLRKGLGQALELLEAKGRLVVISFQETEDRIVKQILKKAARKGQIRNLTKKPVTASKEEINANPRSRSAKLRIGAKL